jgi:hypothetical protein
LQTNLLLKPGTVKDIDSQVEKLLKDLGNPPPPIRLEDVRKLLRLDLGYYSSTNDTWLKQKIHQMRVAGKQVVSQPSLILDVVRGLGLKGLLLPDRRQVLLDEEFPKIKHRWNEAHEITHDILDWHKGLAHGDPEHTLSPTCQETTEAEANYGAGRLLFAGNRFVEEIRSGVIDLERIKALNKTFGNTITSTLWRSVELSLERQCAIVSKHPVTATGTAEEDIKYFVRSIRFADEFSCIEGAMLWAVVKGYCKGTRGPLGSASCVLTDTRGDSHEFFFETFFNGHDALTLGKHVRCKTGVIVLG